MTEKIFKTTNQNAKISEMIEGRFLDIGNEAHDIAFSVIEGQPNMDKDEWADTLMQLTGFLESIKNTTQELYGKISQL